MFIIIYSNKRARDVVDIRKKQSISLIEKERIINLIGYLYF